MPDVFLSYNREDQAVARRFAEAFAGHGIDVWWDTALRSGEAYDEVTENALRSAKAVVVLWSKKSVQSRWVRAEATLADRQKTLVPAMIEPCERPIMFELTQTADLSRWAGDATDLTWLAFLADVRRFVGAGGAAAAPAPIAASPAAQPASNRPSLAILPFTNRSAEREDEVFAGGMVEDIIAALSSARGIKVIAQSATTVYRKNVSDLKTIGRELGARYIMEGNVRRVGADLRVTAQLVEAETGAILWTQKFDRPLAELAYLQEELVLEVAGHLGVQVQRIEMERALKKPGDLTAWEAVMRSWAAYARFGPEGVATSVAEARKAVALAPDYAVAHATLAMGLALSANLGGLRDKAMVREAQTHAERALAIDPNNPTVLFQVSNALGPVGRQAEALRYGERSIELNPNNPSARQALAMMLIYFAREEEALAQLDAEAIIAPRGFTTYISHQYRSLVHWQLGQWERALAAIEQSLALNPNYMIGFWGKVIVLEKLGRHEEARTALRRVRTLDPTATLDLFDLRGRNNFMRPDRCEDAVTTFRKVWEDTPEEPA